MQNIDTYTHTRGESVYLDDIPVTRGTLYGAVCPSPSAHGIIRNLDITEAGQMPGVVKILTYRDIPGKTRLAGSYLMNR